MPLAPVKVEILSDFITPIEAISDSKESITCSYVGICKANEAGKIYIFGSHSFNQM